MRLSIRNDEITHSKLFCNISVLKIFSKTAVAMGIFIKIADQKSVVIINMY